jgi:hypothetical protein
MSVIETALYSRFATGLRDGSSSAAIATPGTAIAAKIKEFNSLLFIMMSSFMVKLISGMNKSARDYQQHPCQNYLSLTNKQLNIVHHCRTTSAHQLQACWQPGAPLGCGMLLSW